MIILNEILDWSMGLPAWQSDAIARLLTCETLSNDDIDDLFALLKVEHDIPDPKGRKAKRISADKIPVATAPDTDIKLVALKNLRHVNAIAENQSLHFIPKGLTLIYGDNGSGKSGYARVLKRACRARDQNEPIHPNAFLPRDKVSNAEATFEIEVNGSPDEVIWINGKTAPEVLSSLAIFDSRCARSYLDDEGDFAYVPYGLDILEGLADICRKLKGMIEVEQVSYTPDKTAFAELVGDTVVGKLIAGLSQKTNREQVEALATITPEEVDRREELDKSLREGNPKEKAIQLRLCASRISKIAQNGRQKIVVVDDSAVTRICGFVDDYHTALQTAALAAEKLKEDMNLLPGTGGEAWKDMFLAARKFLIEAYPGMQFPDLGRDAQCPLCQQPLEEGAERLERFEEFVQQEVEKTAQACKKKLDDAYEVFSTQNVSVGMDNELFEEIKALENVLATETRVFDDALIARHTAIKTAINSRDWTKVAALPSSPLVKLQSLADKLNQQAATLEALTDEKARETLQKEFNELDDRIRLAKVKSPVLAAIECLSRQVKLAECLHSVKTNAISLKASELTEKVVSKELEEALNSEFKCLGVGNLKVCLKSRAEKGKAFHKLILNLPQTKTPTDILSEGEQRAIAISSFLAEVNIGGGLGGIVFDDPVSSLDHKRRERLSRRLALEAAKRQVIIFTHDIYFLNLLNEEAEKIGVLVEKQSVVHRPEGFGVTDPDLPFEGMNTKARVGYLRNRQQEIMKVYKSGDEFEHHRSTADAYRQLRIAWERAVEEVLLRNVVLRFRKGIETQRLSGVSVEDSDYITVDRWMSKCSNYAHDQAMLGGVEVPDPDELLSDINELDKWRLEISDRGEKLSKKRK